MKSVCGTMEMEMEMEIFVQNMKGKRKALSGTIVLIICESSVPLSRLARILIKGKRIGITE